MMFKKTDTIAVTLRGHARTALSNKLMYTFLSDLSQICKIDIYIYTFNLQHGHRIYEKSTMPTNSKISNATISQYFIGLNVKNIIIDDNNFASEINDFVFKSNMSRLTFSKNRYRHMWTSIYKVIKNVKDSGIKYDYCLNMRIDYFDVITKYGTRDHPIDSLFKINIFDNFINLINKYDNITLLNVDVKFHLIYEQFIPFYCNEKKKFYCNEKKKFFGMLKKSKRAILKPEIDIKYDIKNIISGIDNCFAGTVDYLHDLSYIMVYEMENVTKYYVEIYDKFSNLIKSHFPHECILPLIIQNKFDQYKTNIINFKLICTIPQFELFTYDTIFKYEYFFNNTTIDILKLLTILKMLNFSSYLEFGCGFGLLYCIVNLLCDDKIKKSCCVDDYYSQVIEYCEINKKCSFIEMENIKMIDVQTLNYELVFFNTYKKEYMTFLNTILSNSNTKIIIMNGSYYEKMLMCGFIYQDILCDNVCFHIYMVI